MMMSSEPKCAAMSLTTETIALGSATSSVHALALPPDAVIASATARVPSAVRSVTATLAPSSAKACAVARPMPLAAPVTRTVRPFTERESFFTSAMAILARRKMMAGVGLTRLAPIRRQVKQSRTNGETQDERARFQRQAGAGGRRLQRYRQWHRAGFSREGRARRCLRYPRESRRLFAGGRLASRGPRLFAA